MIFLASLEETDSSMLDFECIKNKQNSMQQNQQMQ